MKKEKTVIEGRSEFASRVDQYSPRMKKTQKKIASYLLAHEKECLEMSIYEIADSIGLSVATVTRFCQFLGYAGFAEMKFQMRRQETVFQPNDIGIHRSDNMSTVKQKNGQYVESMIRSCILALDDRSLERAVDAIAHAETVMLTAIGSACGICRAAAGLYASAGIHAVQYDESLLQLRMASMLKKDDVVIAVSYDGQAKTTGDVIMIAKERGALVILVTGDPESLLASYADILLMTPARTRGNAMNIAASQMCQMQILQILVLGTITKYHERFASSSAEQLRLSELTRYDEAMRVIGVSRVMQK